MQEIYTLLENLKDIDTTVLITGASGTGKELVARAVHYGGTRAHRPFVVVNCSALAESVLESELFGHVKGAFTGAIRDKEGRFQLADHGTIFLDEIGDISPSIQLKLLRVLENKEIERVGDATPIKLDVQLISATNADLRDKVRKGEFREDLFYRLKGVEIHLPALTDRRDDIPLLASHFLSVPQKRFHKEISSLSERVEKIFMDYPWRAMSGSSSIPWSMPSWSAAERPSTWRICRPKSAAGHPWIGSPQVNPFGAGRHPRCPETDWVEQGQGGQNPGNQPSDHLPEDEGIWYPGG
jgi:transcriptional regulator with GAF, ATPase, and Fis domain